MRVWSARALALVVQQLPDQRLQSLTGSAFAYLQRVDIALGKLQTFSPADFTVDVTTPAPPAP